MALTLHDQHLAWQQRVGKEVTTASKVLQSFHQFPNYKKSRRSTSLDSRNRSSSSIRGQKQETPSLTQALQRSFLTSNLGVYSEVRGKYARPAPQLNQIMKNPVLNRPTTAGSLKPKSSQGLTEQKTIETNLRYENNEEPVVRPHSSMDFTKRTSSSRRSRKSRQSHSMINEKNLENDCEKKIVRIDEKFLNKKHENIAENEGICGKSNVSCLRDDLVEPQGVDRLDENDTQGKILNDEEQQRDCQELADEEKDLVKLDYEKSLNIGSEKSSTRNSWRTTSSQRRYICELETLLREEKMKRIRLEELLQSIISK